MTAKRQGADSSDAICSGLIDIMSIIGVLLSAGGQRRPRRRPRHPVVRHCIGTFSGVPPVRRAHFAGARLSTVGGTPLRALPQFDALRINTRPGAAVPPTQQPQRRLSARGRTEPICHCDVLATADRVREYRCGAQLFDPNWRSAVQRRGVRMSGSSADWPSTWRQTKVDRRSPPLLPRETYRDAIRHSDE